MAKYKVVFDDSQATALSSMANTIGNCETRLSSIIKNIDSRDRSMATVKCQLAATTAKLPGITRRMRGEASAYRQSVAAYKAAETYAVGWLSYALNFFSIWEILRLFIFLTTESSTVLGNVVKIIVWTLLPSWFKILFPWLKPNVGSGAVPGGSVVCPPPQPAQPQPTPAPKPSGPLKPYPGPGFAGYSVAAGFDAAYCYNQNNYSRFEDEDGRNVGCTATAEAIVASISKGKAISPNEMGWLSYKDVAPGKDWGSTWRHSHEVPGSSGASQVAKLKMIADQLAEGRAVVVRANGKHTVAAIGIRDGADPSNPKPSDILIVDPATGKVTTLDKAVNGGCNMPDNKPLRIAN